MFGYIKRGEPISEIVSVLKELKLNTKISSRFLINMLLQNSDVELRYRIIHYLSE